MKSPAHKLLAGSGWYRATTGTVSTIRHNGIVIVGNTTIAAWTIVDSNSVTHDLAAYFNVKSVQITTDYPALIIPEAWLNGAIGSITFTGTIVLLRHGI